jgi:amino acid transporter
MISAIELQEYTRISLSSSTESLADMEHQVFKREFGYLATFSFAVSISGLFACITTTFGFALTAGGASSTVWAWLISGMGCMCIAASVAEIVSANPTCGGLYVACLSCFHLVSADVELRYYAVSRLAPPEWVPGLCWVDGWLNLMGQIAGIASVCQDLAWRG